MKAPLLLTFCLLYYTTTASAVIYTVSLWNTTYIEKPCAEKQATNNSSMAVLLGSGQQPCTLQVLSSSTLRLHIPDAYIQPHSVHLEYMYSNDVCPIIFEAVDRDSGPCEMIIPFNEVRIHMRGEANVTITEASVSNYDSDSCMTLNDYDLLTSNFSSCITKTYNHIFVCKNLNSECSIYFPTNCTAVLDNLAVKFQCTDPNHMYHNIRAPIIYNINIQGLDLVGNNIIDMTKDTFQHLRHLHSIFLDGNLMTTLNIGVFDGMTSLGFLSLSRSKIQSLPVGVFQDLLSLFFLNLEGNELVTLQPGVFRGMPYLFFLDLGNNRLTTLTAGVFEGLSFLSELYLYNNQLKSLHIDAFMGLNYLSSLDLFSNNLSSIEPGLFHNSPFLYLLDISKNNITELHVNFSERLSNLAVLYVSDNKLSHLEPGSFKEFNNLKELSLANNSLTSLESEQFKHFKFLTYLDLAGNRLNAIPNLVNLSNLNFLNLKGNSLIMIKKTDFIMFHDNTTEVYASQQEICKCYVSADSKCSASEPRSPYLTCKRLLSDRILMALMWVIGMNALCGNIFVLAWRKTQEKQVSVQSLLLSNLAVSDLLMGVYMVIIASADNYFGEYFPMQAEAWRTGITCRIAGAISIVSSEASVFFLVLISIDRFMNMKYPLSTMKLRKKSTLITAAIIWLITLAIGIIPSSLAGQNIFFYDNSHVCIGLPLAKLEAFSSSRLNNLHCTEYSYFCFLLDIVKSKSEGLITGMYFSTAVFLGLNCICYLIILGCYIEIIRVVSQSSKTAGVNKEMREQIKLTIKVSAIIATDFFCWFPVIVLGILVQVGVVILPPSVFAWCVTFVLPINSAINPYLYTISHVISDRRKQAKKSSIMSRRSTISQSTHSQNPQISTISKRQDSKV